MKIGALLASFHDTPALLNPGMHKQFEASIAEAQTMLSRVEASSEAVVMQDDFWPASDSWLAAYRPYIVKNGILLVPVKGVLIHGMGYAFGNYATGYVYLTKVLERGLADDEVKGIAFICDSPGGHVAGNFELVDRIYNARGQKPMRGYAAESAYSACYSIISAVDPGQITVSRTGGVGSIGVVTFHVDVSKSMENEGVKITFIHYGKNKVDGNAYEPLPTDVKARIQSRIDEMGEVFVSTVARNRGMDAQAVRDTEALTFTAKEATSNGLADTIGSLDDAIAVFAADMSNQEEDDMSTKDTSAARSITGSMAAFEAARKEGAVQERQRIQAILDSDEGKRRPDVAFAAAFNSDMTAEQFIKLTSRLQEARTQGFNRVEAALKDAGYGSRKSQGTAGDDKAPLSKADQAMMDAGLKRGLRVV